MCPPLLVTYAVCEVYAHLLLGNPLESVYRQTVTAFAQKLMTLAGAGVRLLIEGVCRDKGVTDGPVTDNNGAVRRRDNLEGKIYGLLEKGLISKHQADSLQQIRFLGNDAAHELDIPAPDTVAAAIDIVEHVFDQVYELPAKAKRLAARTRPGAPAPGPAPAVAPLAPPTASAGPPAAAAAPPPGTP